jgi:hypothetical protein
MDELRNRGNQAILRLEDIRRHPCDHRSTRAINTDKSRTLDGTQVSPSGPACECQSLTGQSHRTPGDCDSTKLWRCTSQAYQWYIAHTEHYNTLVFWRILRYSTKVRFDDVISVQEGHLPVWFYPDL